MRCAIYARVSTKRDEQRNSLDNQIAFTTGIVAEKGWQLVKTYVDDGVSGTTFSKREAIQQLIHDAKRKKIDVVIAKSVSRFGRNSVESVITSYSIHYTKLYEWRRCRSAPAARRWVVTALDARTGCRKR